ncbi:MAG: hypothetical protein M9921_10055 [Fimbriimonadaceae bacterium]|nr:hypothetical protein [Fimbriimonadaceae bacterium]
MKRHQPPFFLALLAALSLGGVASAQGPVPVPLAGPSSIRPVSLSGTWKLLLTDDLQRIADQVNLGSVTAEISFQPEGTFRYVAQGSRKAVFQGKYEIRGNEFLLERLRPNDPWPEGWPAAARGTIDGVGRLTLEGLGFERSLTELFVGSWVLDGDKGTRFELKKDGTFLFRSIGSRAESRGKWEVHGTSLNIRYTEIDGEKVTFDMRNTASVSDAGDSFLVAGRFRYVRIVG